MFFDAVKEYSKTVFRKIDARFFHVALLLVLHAIIVSQLSDTWAWAWTLIFLVTVPPFSGWYFAVYKPKKKA